MAASNRYMNATASYTPSGGSPTPIDGLQDAAYDEGISIKKESADLDQFATIMVCDHKDPSFSLKTINAMVLIATLAGTIGTLAVTYADARNQEAASGGGRLFTMSNAYVEQRQIDGGYRKFGMQTLKFGSFSADGQTHPVAVTAL